MQHSKRERVKIKPIKLLIVGKLCAPVAVWDEVSIGKWYAWWSWKSWVFIACFYKKHWFKERIKGKVHFVHLWIGLLIWGLKIVNFLPGSLCYLSYLSWTEIRHEKKNRVQCHFLMIGWHTKSGSNQSWVCCNLHRSSPTDIKVTHIVHQLLCFINSKGMPPAMRNNKVNHLNQCHFLKNRLANHRWVSCNIPPKQKKSFHAVCSALSVLIFYTRLY